MGPRLDAMSKIITIGLTGLAGAGKDTVADTLVTHAGFSKIAFADALRAEVAQAFTLAGHAHVLSDREHKERQLNMLSLRYCHDHAFVDLVADLEHEQVTPIYLTKSHSPRQILQWWGTEYRRAQQPNYWSTKVAMRIAQMRANDQVRVVITDCRFANEAAAVRTLGGEIWQVTRPGQPIVEGGHASQTDGSNLRPDATLVNGSDINGLRHSVLRLLQARHGGAVIGVL